MIQTLTLKLAVVIYSTCLFAVPLGIVVPAGSVKHEYAFVVSTGQTVCGLLASQIAFLPQPPAKKCNSIPFVPSAGNVCLYSLFAVLTVVGNNTIPFVGAVVGAVTHGYCTGVIVGAHGTGSGVEPPLLPPSPPSPPEPPLPPLPPLPPAPPQAEPASNAPCNNTLMGFATHWPSVGSHTKTKLSPLPSELTFLNSSNDGRTVVAAFSAGVGTLLPVTGSTLGAVFVGSVFAVLKIASHNLGALETTPPNTLAKTISPVETVPSLLTTGAGALFLSIK